MRIAITQRVEVVKSYGERRDCLDQRWADLSDALGAQLFPLSNSRPESASMYLETLQPDLIILSGGNSITALDETAEDVAPERDQFEQALMSAALDRKIPVLGVCRGMQVLNLYFGGRLSPVAGHVAKRHDIQALTGDVVFDETVNSFHNWGLKQGDLAKDLIPLARSADKTIEAFRHKLHDVTGIMWHPEREKVFSLNDLNLIRSLMET